MLAELVDGDLPPSIAREIRYVGHVAVDTETSGLDWATDVLHLCQVYTDETGPVLIRPVSQQPPRNLAAILGDPEVAKVFHFAPFDLRFLEHRWGLQVTRVECTKTASKLLDPGRPPSDHGLQSLLGRHLGVSIGKGPVRVSDWGAKSLTAEQIAYAVEDVAHLMPLVAALRDRLSAAGRLQLYEQVCAYLPVATHLEVSGIPDPLAY